MTTDGIQNKFSRAEIAEALEISGNQILQYQERGLLAERTAHAQDIAYNSLDIARLRFILRCEAAGYKGKDVIDFIGTINKGAGIKEQLKASLVHAHQKFSYVNAQKRKADILEQVSLQADADLIQKYIDEMKEVLANPQSSTLPAAPPKPQPPRQPEPKPTPKPSARSTETEKNWSTQLETQPEKPSKLKAGLERSKRFGSDTTQVAPPQRSSAAAAPKRSTPSKPQPQKARSKFIDSSSSTEEYQPPMTDSSQDDLYIDYSRSKKPSFAAWKQTIITFLILSVVSFAGYTYYVLKFQKPTIADLPTSIQESRLSENQGDLDVETNLASDKANGSSDSQETLTEEQISSKEKVAETDSGTTKPVATEVESTDKDESLDTDNDQPAPETTTAIPSPTTKPEDDVSTSTPPPSTNTTTAQKPPDSSFSETATKDLDDLLSKKQSSSQTAIDDYQVAERPQVAVYGFKVFYQLSRKILIAKFKIARIRPQRNLIQGRLFVVFKPRQSAQSLKYFSVPDTRMTDGVPTEPFKGIEFSFAESTKVQSVRTIYVRDPSQFDVATIFVFSNAGELVLRKDFTVNVTEY